MPWVRLDEEFADHPKVTRAGPLAGWLHVCALGYCNRFLTDGFVPTDQVPKLANFTGIYVDVSKFGIDHPSALDLAAVLVRVGLWIEEPDGYRIHDYHEYQPSKAEVLAQRKAKSEAGKKGAANRWRPTPMAPEMASAKADEMAPAMAPATESDVNDGRNGTTDGTCHGKTMAERWPVPVPVPDTESQSQTLCAVPAQILAFEPFWHDYPKRNGKRLGRDKAESRWKQMSVRERSAALLAVAHYATACNTGITIAKDPDRWLRDKCWNDWQEPAMPQAKLTPTQGALLRAQARGR